MNHSLNHSINPITINIIFTIYIYKDYFPFITMEFVIPNATIKTSICLNMIVKNESHVIVETLENLCSYINFSYWVISDTGSTDNTKEVITSFFLAKNIPGEIVEHEWRDFGHNRSKALECAYNKTDYLLIFDADDRLIGDFKLPAVYDKDQYQLLFGTNFVYTRPLLINNRKKWCFKGVLHESLSSMEQVNGASIIEGNYHVMSGRTGARSQNPNKYIDDANILKKAHFDELKTDYNLSCRYAFYCAQSYKDAGENYYDDAIEWYKKCLDLKMWVQEKFYGCLNIGLIYSYKKDYMNALKYWYKTIEYDPERIEGIIHAMNYLRNDGQHILINALYHKFKNYNKNLEGKLFLFKNVYNDELEYHNTISAFYVHDKKSGYECCKNIILNNTISSTLLKSTISNMQFYIDFLKDDCVSLNTNTDALKMFYVVDKIMGDMSCKKEPLDANIMNIWNILFEKSRPLLTTYNNNFSFTNRELLRLQPSEFNHSPSPHFVVAPDRSKNPKIIISFTTCKRLELFKQTIHSILNHWLDIDKIDYWFCVDDNSCEEDRNNMKTLYPWIEYYMKNMEEKGHKRSMNIIWDKLNELKPTYWIHMEDDFLFHTKMNYIEEAIRGLRSNSCADAQVKQILFNKAYGETIEQYNSGGHVVNNSSNSIIVHDFKIGVFPYQNCHYWPHYSFRPSLTDVNTILELGNFDTEDTFFEMTYAKKWTTAGYKSGFFNKITNRHIGRLTMNRGDKTSPNAYELNSEAQFYKPAATAAAAAAHEPSIKIINLERRTDRKEATIKKLSDVGINEDQYEFIKAVDGFALEPTIELKRVFGGNDFGSRKGFIGCALSHYDLWKRLLVDDKNEYYVIMEDDFSLCSHFKQKFISLLPVFKEKEMLFMGYHMFENNRQKVLDIYVYSSADASEYHQKTAVRDATIRFPPDDPSSEIIKVEPLNKNLYIGGYFMYSINKKGAQICIDYIQRYGIKHGIDYIVKIMPNLCSFETQPHMAFSIWNEHGVPIDSDIQNIGDCFDFSKIENLSSDADAVDNDIPNKLLRLTPSHCIARKEFNHSPSTHCAVSTARSKYMFIPDVDHYGGDIYYHKKPLQTCFEIAEKDEICVAFNTLGFFKNKVDIHTLKSSPYFKKGDGIYIKKEYYDSLVLANKSMCDSSDISDSSVIRIKMLCNWTNSESLCKQWSNMCDDPVNFRWKNYQLVWTDNKDEIDYYVIINAPPRDAYFDPLKTIVFQMEPWVNDPTKNWGVKTWGQWAEPDPSKFLAVRGRKTAHHNNAFWQLELTYKELLDIDLDRIKQHTISSICSSKYYDEGHITRIDLLKYIEQKNDPNVQIDIYNADNKHNFTNYKGPVSPYVDKSKGMLSYKYYFMMENNYEEQFITEKIWEPILCESLVFYYGCPNVTDYIDARAFVLLDPNDFEKSYQIIKQAIEEDWWSQRIDVIRQEKRKILNELSFFPTIDNIIMRCNNNNNKLYKKYFGDFVDSNNNNNNDNPKKYCFIHSCHFKDVGLNILNDIISKIINSGSILFFEKIFILNIGEKIDQNAFNDHKIQIINYSDDVKLFELQTINLIRAFCEYNDNCEILYLHTKGVTCPNSKSVSDWKNMMIHFLVNKYSACFDLLKDCDTIGCNYMQTPHKHYSGNFWWANSNYIKRLNNLSITGKRHDAEWWILSDVSVKSYEIHHSGINHYHAEYPSEKYLLPYLYENRCDPNVPNYEHIPDHSCRSINIVVARYNEDIEWTKQFENVTIYNKGDKLGDSYKEILLKNVGREGHTYYKHICDNYDNLDPYTIFLQGNPFYHSPNIINNLLKYIHNTKLDVDFEFLSEKVIYSCLDYECRLNKQCTNIFNTYDIIFNTKCSNIECIFGAGAQFIVSKTQILKKPKTFYKNIVKMLENNISPGEGYDIERLHKYILCKEYIPILEADITGNERQIGVKNLLQKCAHKYYNPRIYDIPFNTHDRGNENELAKEYSMCYNKNNPNLEKYCGPDWTCYHWPSANIFSFEDTKNEIIIEANKPPIINKIGWYGNIYSPLPDVIEHKTRPLLKKIGDEHPDLFDILHILPNNNGVINTLCANYLSLSDLIKYKYLIDIGGNGYSGRLKYLLFSKRPLLLVDRNYIEYFYNDLIPYVHYIPVNMDLSNLLEQVEWMKLNDDKCTEMANNAFEFAMNYFTEDKLLERIHYVYQNICMNSPSTMLRMTTARSKNVVAVVF